jgi:integrase
MVKLSVDNQLFCVDRLWDQRAEAGYMKKIEDEFQALVDELERGRLGPLSPGEHRCITRFWGLWHWRNHFIDSPLEDIRMNGVGGQSLSLDKKEILESRWYAFAEGEGTLAARVMTGLHILRAIRKLPKKQKYLSEDPAENIKMRQTKSAEKPVMLREQILSLIEAITDLHDLCLLYIGIFCGPRSSEVFGFQWASWNGESLLPLWTAYEGNLYEGRTKTKQSKTPIHVPDQVRLVIEAWRRICPMHHRRR